MNQKKRRRRLRRNLIIAGTGGTILAAGLAGAKLASSRASGRNRNPSGITRGYTSPQTNTTQESINLLPASKVKLSSKARRDRGLARLSVKQRQNLENKYGYSLETQSFRKNISKSSRRKAAKIMKSLGRFRLCSDRYLVNFSLG